MALSFLWGSGKKGRKVHWVKGFRMNIPKNKGGMDFRDIECFNQAMLAKQGWRILTNPSSLVTAVSEK